MFYGIANCHLEERKKGKNTAIHTQHQTQGKGAGKDTRPQEALLGQRQRKTRDSAAKQQSESATSDTRLESVPAQRLHDLHHTTPLMSEPVPITSVAV